MYNKIGPTSSDASPFPFSFLFHHPSSIIHLPSYISIGPNPIQLVVVIAVKNAVSAATTTFTAISIIFFFIHYVFRLIHFLNTLAGHSFSPPE